MLAVTQFEVHVYQHGRWSIHARYSSEEREEAIRDAGATESITGRPTKVIRETYFPKTNSTETVTVYVSPKTKELREKAGLSKKSKPGSKSAAHQSRPKGTHRTRQRLSARNVFFRIVVATGVSLATTTLIIGVLAWMLQRFAEIGVPLSSTVINMVLTYGYIAIFLFSFTSLFRSRLPLHRLLADLWATSRMDKTAERIRSHMGPLPKLKPKHDKQTSPEHLREWEEMKVRRGDLDAATPPEFAGSEGEAQVINPEPSPAAATAPEPKTDQRKQERKAAEAKTKAETKPEPALAEPAPKTSKPDSEASKSRADADASAKDTSADDDARTLERTILRRFFNDVIVPATKAMSDDPVTRRGGALVMAGASAALLAASQREADSDLVLLKDIATVKDIAPYLTETFLRHYSEHVAEDDNSSVVAAGRTAMAGYLAGETDLARTVAAVLSEWRTPFAQPPGVVPANAAYTSNDAATNLLGVYVLTEVRHRKPTEAEAANDTLLEAAHDAAMGMHNTIVRAAIATHNGNEITHTGKGIFAHYESADEALDAATDIRQQFKNSNGANIAIAVIGNFNVDEDPNYSPALSRQAQAVIAEAKSGEILCESEVHDAAKRPRATQPGNSLNEKNGDKDETGAFVSISPETTPIKPAQAAQVS